MNLLHHTLGRSRSFQHTEEKRTWVKPPVWPAHCVTFVHRSQSLLYFTVQYCFCRLCQLGSSWCSRYNKVSWMLFCIRQAQSALCVMCLAGLPVPSADSWGPKPSRQRACELVCTLNGQNHSGNSLISWEQALSCPDPNKLWSCTAP